MARLEPVDPRQLGFFARWLARLVDWATKRKLGKTLSSSRIAAHHGKLFFGRAMAEGMLLQSHHVDDRLKTLCSLRAAMLAGCPH